MTVYIASDNLMRSDVPGVLVFSRVAKVYQLGVPMRMLQGHEHTEVWRLQQINRSLRLENLVTLRPPGQLQFAKWRGSRVPYTTALPIQPLWTGVILNLTLWSTSIAIARLLFVSLRCAVRRAHILCPACASSLSGLPSSTTSCPECGKPLHAKSATVPSGGSPLPTHTAANDPT